MHSDSNYKIVTDSAGKLAFPGGSFSMRVIGATDNLIHTDFSTSGKTADVDWTKVWNSSTPDGKGVGMTTAKTGKIVADAVVRRRQLP